MALLPRGTCGSVEDARQWEGNFTATRVSLDE